MLLENKKIAVLAADDYEVLEAWYPILRLKEEGAEVDVVAWDGVKNDHVKSKSGYPLSWDLKAADADPSRYDAVIVPGGYAPDSIRQCMNSTGLVKYLADKGKVVAAICHGGWVLASADVLKGRTVTSTPAIKDDMENAGASWVDREVVDDKNIITSRRPDDLPVFMKNIISKLED